MNGKQTVSPHYSFPADLAARIEELDLGLESLFFAWEIASLAGRAETETEAEAEADLRRPVALLALACLLAAAEGHTRLPLADQQTPDLMDQFAVTSSDRDAVHRLLTLLQQGPGQPEAGGFAAVFGRAGDYRPLIYDRGSLYLQKFHLLEERVSAALRERINWLPPEAGSDDAEILPAQIDEALQDVLRNPAVPASGKKISLDAGQQLAVKRALEGRLTVVSGRPGSGKTAIVADLLRVIARLQHPPLETVALAAPTGKAADRIRASVVRHLAAIANAAEVDRMLLENCPPAMTLHRLLGYSPAEERFRHSERNPLAEKLVIVDESSMLDLALMDSLLRALQPDAKLLLLGDADQLPPVDAGAVLRDLCHSKQAVDRGRVVMLKNSYRAQQEESAGARILAFAAALNSGTDLQHTGREGSLTECTEQSALTYEGVEIFTPREDSQRRSFLESWLSRHLGQAEAPDLPGAAVYHQTAAGFEGNELRDLERLFAYYERFKILCVTRVTAAGTGSEQLNSWLHQRWLERLREKGLPGGTGDFALGEPVIVNRNDYRLRLYNGDSGIVLRISAVRGLGKSLPEPMAVFQRGESFSAFPLQALRGRIEPAWAITVHKAQGSEYDHVALILPANCSRPLSRELLYTAVTRARRSVVVVGSAAVLQEAALRPVDRLTGVAEILDASYT